MKKYIFMAIMASLIILPGCKKKTETAKENGTFLIQTYNDCKQLLGVDHAVAIQAILAEGWTTDTIEESEATFIKQEGNLMMELDIEFIEDSIVLTAECIMANTASNEYFSAADWKALIENIGEKPTVSDEVVPFKGLKYGESYKSATKVETYQAAVDALPEAYAAISFAYYWESNNRAIQVGKGTLDGITTNIIGVSLVGED